MQLQTILDFLKRPIVMAVLAVILGFVLGLGWGWGVDPVKFVDSTPAYMRADLQEDYLRMAIDSLMVNADINAAIRRWQDLGPNGPALLAKATADPKGLNPQALAAFTQIATQYPPTTGGAAAAPGATVPAAGAPISLGTWVISIAGILILAVAVIAGFIFLRRLLANRSGEPSVGMQAAEISRKTEKTNFEDMGLAPPITQTMTTYILGDDLYDESFSIDTGGGEFLGEYGVGVSETIGVGDPKKVTALEIWLFDKNDIKTATKVLMSPHAFNDPGIRGRLEPKGELVVVEPQKQIILETETLQLLATIVDLQYGQGPMPAESYFDRLTLELAIWPKGG